MSCKIIVNIFYQPGSFLTKLLELDEGRLYYPINGGASLRRKFEPKWLHFDDAGDNISMHNHALNEMTSIYWFWKNYPWQKLKYVGFNHYRRLFHPKDMLDIYDYDIIAAKPYEFSIDLEGQYWLAHNMNDLQKLVGILAANTQVGVDFAQYMNQKILKAPCNMFVMKAELFDKYCRFMFPILFKLEEYIQLSQGNKYQHRAIAFLSERLTSFWINTQSQKKIKEIKIWFKQ